MRATDRSRALSLLEPMRMERGAGRSKTGFVVPAHQVMANIFAMILGLSGQTWVCCLRMQFEWLEQAPAKRVDRASAKL